MIVLAACINPDLTAVVGSEFGQPMAQVSELSTIAFLCRVQVNLG